MSTGASPLNLDKLWALHLRSANSGTLNCPTCADLARGAGGLGVSKRENNGCIVQRGGILEKDRMIN
jgi:hypothetical protein